MDFAQRLEEVKLSNHFTNSQIGAICGVSESAVRTWLQGAKTPSITAVSALADKINVSVDYLLGKTYIKNKPATEYSDELTNQINSRPILKEVVERLSALDDVQLQAVLSVLGIGNQSR